MMRSSYIGVWNFKTEPPEMHTISLHAEDPNKESFGPFQKKLTDKLASMNTEAFHSTIYIKKEDEKIPTDEEICEDTLNMINSYENVDGVDITDEVR